MWQNWKPNFPSYSFELTAGDQSSTAYTILKTIFRCQEIVLEKYNTSSSFDAKIKWNGSQLTLLNARVQLKYPENTYKMIKFKSSSGDEVRVSMTAMEVYDGHNNKLDIGDWVFGGSYAVAWGELGGKKNEIILTKPIKNNNEITFNYIAELGLEDYNEPYYWDNKEWTPNQLKFSSIVKYSNILREDNSDRGSAVSLPETSSDTGASSYEQDENGYCYIKDSEGNIVYNKFLNPLARKTKINNGYRINGDQSLELLSFGNNIYDISQKTEGQFLFKNDKKQDYGLKKDDNVSSALQQNVPYFGGQPAIYPVIVYSNMLSNSEDVTVIKNDTNIIINNKSFAYNKEKDIIIYYVRNAYQSEDVIYKTKVKDYSKKEEWRFKFLGSNPFKSGDISCQLTDQATNISFSAEKAPVIWSAELTNNLGVLSDTILDNPNNLTTSQKEYFDKIVEYVDINFYVGSSLKYQEDWFYFNHNMNLSIGVFYGGGLDPAAFYFTGNAIKIPYVGTSSATYYVSSNSSATCSPDFNKTYGIFRIPISINYNHLPGLFPKTIGFFAESSDKGEKNISLNGKTGKRTWEIQAFPFRTSISDSSGYTDYGDTQFLFDYTDVYYNANNVPERVGGPDILGYIEFNNNSAQQAIAIVIWKNGKLLENS